MQTAVESDALVTAELNLAIAELTAALSERVAAHKFDRELMYQLSDCAPVLFWAKDLDGKYVYANKAHREWLGVDVDLDITGLTDVDFALKNRALCPDDKAFHNFGEVCANSDVVTLKLMTRCRFL
jgi:PAS domain-containing protein